MGEIFTPTKNLDSVAWQNVPASLRGKVIPISKLYGNNGRLRLGDSTSARVHDANFAFLSTALAKLNPKIVEPKGHTTYADDIPVNVGGGFVDYIEYFSVNYAGIANSVKNIMGNNATSMPRVNAGMAQNIAKVFTFEIGYDIGFIEMEKMKKIQLQKSLESIYKSAIVLSWDYFCQEIAYNGTADTEGLFNNTKVVPTNSTAISKAGILDGSVSDTAIAGLFNGIIQEFAENSGMNIDLAPDTFLVPMWLYSALIGRFSNLYTDSLYNYILGHNFSTSLNPNIKITIKPRSQLDTLGTAGVGRIVAYKKDEDFVRLDMPYPIQHYITLPNIDRMCYTTAFVGQVSAIQLPYNSSNIEKASPVQYWDLAA